MGGKSRLGSRFPSGPTPSGRPTGWRRGAVAQMGERCNRTAEVRGSIPLSSTSLFNIRSCTLRPGARGRPHVLPARCALRSMTNAVDESGRAEAEEIADARQQELHSNRDQQEAEDPGHRVDPGGAEESGQSA